jgi:hypothetical protein
MIPGLRLVVAWARIKRKRSKEKLTRGGQNGTLNQYSLWVRIVKRA